MSTFSAAELYKSTETQFQATCLLLFKAYGLWATLDYE